MTVMASCKMDGVCFCVSRPFKMKTLVKTPLLVGSIRKKIVKKRTFYFAKRTHRKPVKLITNHYNEQ